MQMPKAALSAVLILFAGCASVPEPGAPLQVELTPGDVGMLADLLRREDARQYDSAAFQGFLASRSDAVRVLSVRALGRMQNRAAVAPLTRALSDPSVHVRAEAGFALGQLQDTSAAIVAALGGSVRRQGSDAAEAVAALGKLRTDSGRAHVERVLAGNYSAQITQEALLASFRYQRKASTTSLITKYLKHDNPEIRWRAAYALTRGLADPAVVPQLLELARSKPSDLATSFAIRGLRAVTADSAGRRADALAALTARVSDPHPAVRINAILALGGYRDSTVAGPLTPLLQHADVNTRVSAAQTLGATGGSLAMTTLEGVAADVAQRPVVRGAALAAIARRAPERGRELAARAAASPNWLDRLYAVRALAGDRSPLAFPLLRAWSRDPDSRVVLAAVEAVKDAPDTLVESRALFIERLAAPDPFVRSAALGGLAKFADPADQILLFDAYARALEDSVPEAAVAALDAIAKLVPGNAAVDRAFRIRFPAGAQCPHADVRVRLLRHFQMPDQCGASPTVRVYEQVVRELIVPGLQGRNPRARITTAGTTVEIELLAADAPLTVRNFMALAARRYFDGARWHRVVPNFVIQDGDPYGNGSGGPGYAIRDEMNRVRYGIGTVGMALDGPDTGGSQFFITHSPQPHLDGGYTVFGRVLGMTPAVHQIAQDDVIERIEIIR